MISETAMPCYVRNSQADLKSCTALGAFGTTAVTALTAQNSHGVAWTPLEVCQVMQVSQVARFGVEDSSGRVR